MAIITCNCDTASETNGNHSCPNGGNTSYEGRVLQTFERNGYDDSDFCAIVWTGERLEEVTYASTRGWTYHNDAKVDATEAVRAEALQWYRSHLYGVLLDDEKAENAKPVKGRKVRSTTTRGKAAGITGTVFWRGVDKYNSTRYITIYRVGIETEDGTKVFIPESKAEVIAPLAADTAKIAKHCETAIPANWRSARYHITGIL